MPLVDINLATYNIKSNSLNNKDVKQDTVNKDFSSFEI